MDRFSQFKPTSTRLMDQVREVLRFYHYAYNTEQSYVDWILKYIRFNDTRHPRDMGKPKIERLELVQDASINFDKFLEWCLI